MKVFKYITFPTLAVALLLMVATMSCEESAPLSIDPVETEVTFNFEPSHGYPGQTVKIMGTGFGDVQKIAFANTEGEILQKSDTEIMAKIPVGAISGKIKLVKVNSMVTSTNDFTIDLTPIPTIIGFTPAVVGSGKEVVITGNQLNEVDSVYIGEMRAEMLPGGTATSLTILTPAGLQTGLIRLFYDYMTSYGIQKVGESASSTQLSLALPVISSFSVDITSLDVGDEFSIYGSMLHAVTMVQFGTVTAEIKSATDSELVTTVPAGATTGKIILTVADGTVESSINFIVNLPAIATFNPTKGQEVVGPRVMTITGTNLDLVQTVSVGGAAAKIETQSATVLTITFPGSAQGQVELHTINGTVLSAGRFLLAGDFWVIDFDNTFVPRRFTHAAWDGTGTNTGDFEIRASGEARGNYGRSSAVVSDGGSPRFYIRGDGTNANPAPDRFLLYTDNSQGVFFEFDISFNAIPPSMVNENGEVAIKMHMFAADQARGYGYSQMYYVKYEGPGVWQHVRVNTNNMGKETGSGGLFNNTIPALSNRFEPNNCRIVGFVFTGAQSNPEAVGQTIDVNFDNVKFVID